MVSFKGIKTEQSGNAGRKYKADLFGIHFALFKHKHHSLLHELLSSLASVKLYIRVTVLTLCRWSSAHFTYHTSPWSITLIAFQTLLCQTDRLLPPARSLPTHRKINLKVGFRVINALILLLTIPDYKTSMTVVADMLLMTSTTLHQSRAFKLRSSDWSLTLLPRFANVA